jgi:hypothetical protein
MSLLTTNVKPEWVALKATELAPHSARAFAQAVLTAWSASGLIDNVILVMSEIVTNAVTATRAVMDAQPDPGLDEVELIGAQLRLGPETLFVEIWDLAADQPIKQDPDSQSEGGRGLLLVEFLSLDWGVAKAEDGKIVYAEIAVSPKIRESISEHGVSPEIRESMTTYPSAYYAMAEAALRARL